MHKLLDQDGNLPINLSITEGIIADNKGAFNIPMKKASIFVVDHYDNNFPILNIWDSRGAS